MKELFLRWLRLPARPDPPPGSDDTLLQFRSSKKALAVDFVRWGVGQVAALGGILFSLAIFGNWNLPVPLPIVGEIRRELDAEGLQIASWVISGDWMHWMHLIELAALGFFVVQLVASGFLLRLAWELRWYMVSDESLRIREGLWSTHERTMTVANIQNLSIRQGPLQKLLGLADLEVHTAGGKHAQAGTKEDQSKNLHVGRFRDVEDAEGLRDRIRGSLKRHRGLGLGGEGDEEEHLPVEQTLSQAEAAGGGGDAVAAASELLAEARALRAALAGKR